MFERFTDRARRVVVLAQEEARMLGHNYIGTEHVLLGLLHEGEGVAGQTLSNLGVSLLTVRFKVEETIGRRQTQPGGHLPFTPRAKKVLELSLREAKALDHNYIGTEHILLGLIREGEGVAATVLTSLGVDLEEARAMVVATLEAYGEVAAAGGGTAFRPPGRAPRPRAVTGPMCPSCAASLDESAVYKVLDVPEHEGPGKASVLFLYCKGCGLAIDDLILPGE